MFWLRFGYSKYELENRDKNCYRKKSILYTLFIRAHL